MADKQSNENEQPDFEDDQAVVEWVNDTSVDNTERQLRANEVYSRESRRPQPRGNVMNAVSDARSAEGPPRANY